VNALQEAFHPGASNGARLHLRLALAVRPELREGRTKQRYEPSLTLRHHLAPFRLKFSYMIRLMYGYGVSYVRSEP
jgi:hypothetical protein